jgi:hypothetical protein
MSCSAGWLRRRQSCAHVEKPFPTPCLHGQKPSTNPSKLPPAPPLPPPAVPGPSPAPRALPPGLTRCRAGLPCTAAGRAQARHGAASMTSRGHPPPSRTCSSHHCGWLGSDAAASCLLPAMSLPLLPAAGADCRCCTYGCCACCRPGCCACCEWCVCCVCCVCCDCGCGCAACRPSWLASEPNSQFSLKGACSCASAGSPACGSCACSGYAWEHQLAAGRAPPAGRWACNRRRRRLSCGTQSPMRVRFSCGHTQWGFRVLGY